MNDDTNNINITQLSSTQGDASVMRAGSSTNDLTSFIDHHVLLDNGETRGVSRALMRLTMPCIEFDGEMIAID